MNGILLINKPLEWTSFDVVAKARNKLTREAGRKIKVGHTGTLDPLSTGVLVLCVGKATRLIEFMVGADKAYEAEITLGATSTTDDGEGEVAEDKNASPVPLKTIQQILHQFIGEIDQVPPDFSAKQVDGKRAYKAARAGKPLSLKPQKVTIESVEILDYKWPVLQLKIECGKGAYIRSLARDIGKALGVGGYLTGLIRTRVGMFSLADCIGIDQVSEDQLRPLGAVLPHLPARAKLKI